MSSIEGQIEQICQGILETIEQTDFKELTARSEIVGILHLTDVRRRRNLSKAWTKPQQSLKEMLVK